MAKKSTMKSAKNRKITVDNNSLSGFTIIEVVLVLAIAGLIFMMVFIALPQLQRAQRDTQRRDDMGRLTGAITNYQSANNGRLPSGTCTVADDADPLVESIPHGSAASAACRLIREYILGSAGGTTANTFVDPSGKTYDLQILELPSGAVPDPVAGSATGEVDGVIKMYTHARCVGETIERTSNPRDYAVTYKLEGGGTYCSSNNG